MPPMLISLLQVIVNSVILLIIYCYLYVREKKDYLRIWALGWFFQFLRFICEIWLVYRNFSLLRFSIDILNVLSAYMIVHGTYIFVNKQTPKQLKLLVALNFLWLPVAFLVKMPFYIQVFPALLFTSIIYIATGIAFIMSIDTPSVAKYITGITFILWGIHKINYPFLRPIPDAANWAFFITSIFEIIAALGILMIYFERAKQIEQVSKEELKQEHERFKVTLKSIGDGVITTDAKGFIDFINPVAQELTGYNELEAVGRHIRDIFNIVNEYTGEAVEVPIDTVLRKGIVKGLANHTVLIRKDGSKASIADSAAPIKNIDGQIVGVVLVFQDITVHREIEKSREQLAFIVKSSREAIFSLDLDYRITSWNKGAESIYGYKAEEILGKSAYILVPRELYRELDEHIAQALSERTPLHYETVRLHKNGCRINLLISISPIFDDYDNVLGISVIAHDISDRLRSQEMLKRYKMLSESTTDIILFVRYPDGKIIEANRAAVEALGYKLDEFINLNIFDLTCDIGKENTEILMEKALKGVRFESVLRRKDGSTFPVEVSATGGMLQGQQVILGICRDVTERKHFEDQLRYMSRHDYLTGLYNRLTFEEKLIQLKNNPPYPFAVVMCDLDGLKMINDTFGHETGDIFIKAAASNLKKAVRPQDFLARTAGDEFVIIIPNADKAIVEEIIGRIRYCVQNFNDCQLPIPLNISIGYAIVENEDFDIKEALKTAENNMYREKVHHSISRKSSIIKTLMKMLEARDIITQDHSQRTEKMAVKLANRLNMSQRQIEDIKLLAMFHDIGKVGIPDSLLFKKGRLTREERLEMQRHTEIGHRIAVSSPELAHISDWILLHHEWWDGNGYPLGLKGEEIPIECRILAIVDSYDAMIQDRPYRKAMSHEEAVAELKRCAGTQFDPHLVELFIKILEEEAETA